MHCFSIIEVHYPDRVMYQFRLYQHIPNDVDILDDLYIINRHKEKDD
jgi:hypothetical protein